MIRSYDEACQAMEACMYPSKGVRGYGPRRANDYGMVSQKDYCASVDDRLLRFIQLEHIDAMRDLDRILTIKEIDAFIFGPNDLSASMGKMGQFNDPQVRQVIDEGILKINAAGKVAGLSLGASDEATMRQWYDRGIRMLSAGFDTKYIMSGAKDNLAAMRRAFNLEA